MNTYDADKTILENTYNRLLGELADARALQDSCETARKGIIEAARSSEGFVFASEQLEKANVLHDEAERKIREIAMTQWMNTKNKHPHEKIEVKIFKTFKVISPEVLREWVLKNLPAALSPDMKKVEKYALEIGDVDGTEKGEQARVQIASKL